MIELWQNLTIILICGVAVVYLSFHFVRWRRRRKGCSECHLMKSIGVNKRGESDPTSRN